jgi:hypothetical protein
VPWDLRRFVTFLVPPAVDPVVAVRVTIRDVLIGSHHLPRDADH